MEIVDYVDIAGQMPFREWLYSLQDKLGRTRIIARLTRVAAGNLGDCKPLREGVMELRIDHGPGYRVYLSRQGAQMVLLLCASDKSNQDRAINLAIKYLNDWKLRGKP